MTGPAVGTGAVDGSPGGGASCGADGVERTGFRVYLFRGLIKRCPRCGCGALFERWTRMRETCPSCGLRYLEDRGDPWAFLMVIDRAAFIFPLVAALYFGLHLVRPALFIAFGIGLGAVFLATTPNRYGASVALVHWVRWRFSRVTGRTDGGDRTGDGDRADDGDRAGDGDRALDSDRPADGDRRGDGG